MHRIFVLTFLAGVCFSASSFAGQKNLGFTKMEWQFHQPSQGRSLASEGSHSAVSKSVELESGRKLEAVDRVSCQPTSIQDQYDCRSEIATF